MLTSYSKCQCGAITVYTNGVGYSVSMKNRKKFLPGLDLRKLHKLPDTYSCDHCGNHFGLDLCACGSGESPEECNGGFDECGTPSQVLYGRTCVLAADAIGF